MEIEQRPIWKREHKNYHLRLYAFLSLIAVIFFSITLYFLETQSLERTIMSIAERRASRLADEMIDVIYEKFMIPVMESEGVIDLSDERTLKKLDDLINFHYSGHDVARVVLYDDTGMIAYSTLKTLIGRDASSNPHVRQALAGKIASRAIAVGPFDDLDVAKLYLTGNVVETYLPFSREFMGQTTRGVIELYLYLGDTEIHLRKSKTYSLLTVGIGSTMLFLLLFVITYKLDKNRRALEGALRESELKFSSLARASNDGIITSDKLGNIIQWNEGAQNIFGCSEGEALGRPFAAFVSGIDKFYYQDTLKHAVENGVTGSSGKTVESRGIRKNGEEFPLEVSLFKWSVEKEGFFSGIIRDITERKQTEESLKKYTKKMENALNRAGDVLRFISKSPRIMPFFVTSQPYRFSPTIGGGDTVCWLSFKSKYAGLYVHDVSGHDIEEILLNILATALADAHKIIPRKRAVSVPSAFLTGMNEQLLMFCKDSSHFVTAVYLLLDFEGRNIQLSLAGHPRPWLINQNGSAKQVGEYGYLMGMLEIKPETDNRYTDESIKLNNGQILLVYTDGLMEQIDRYGKTFEKKFKEEIIGKLAGKEPNQAYDILKSEFESHVDGQKPDDDVSFIFIGARPEEKYETSEYVPSMELLEKMVEHTVEVQSVSAEKPDARRDSSNENDFFGYKVISDLSDPCKPIVKKLETAGWPKGKIGNIKQVLLEVIANAIMHGNKRSDRRKVKLSHVIHDGVLEVVVSDEGEGIKSDSLSQAIGYRDMLTEHGRGFHIICAYADEVYLNEPGNSIWVLFSKD